MVDLTEAAEQMRVEEELDEVNIHNSRDQLKHTGKQLTYSLKWSQEGIIPDRLLMHARQYSINA